MRFRGTDETAAGGSRLKFVFVEKRKEWREHFCAFAECNMWFGWVMLFFCLSQTELAKVWEQQQTGEL